MSTSQPPPASPVVPASRASVSEDAEPASTTIGARSGSTLVEQHADLLSFIAKKERKCLDLREELKRHEDELRALKAKWETIAARDLISARASPVLPSSAPTTPSPTLHRSARFPNAIDATTTPTSPMTPDSSAGASAKRWMGGLVKTAQAGVTGLLENLAAPPELNSPSPTIASTTNELGTVREEDEDEEADGFDDDARRESTGSQASSVDMSSTASAASSFEGGRSSSISSLGTEESEVSIALSVDDPVALGISHANAQPRKAPPPTGSRAEKHARRRSTFDVLGATASQWSGSLGRKWGEVTSSDLLKSGKRATLSFVDTFEKTLSEAIAVDDEVTKDQGVGADLGEYGETTPVLGQVAKPTFGWSSASSPKLPHEPSMATSSSSEWDWNQLLSSSTVPPPTPPKSPRLSHQALPATSTTPKANANPLMEEEDDVTTALWKPMVSTRPAHRKRMSLPARPLYASTLASRDTSKDDEWGAW